MFTSRTQTIEKTNGVSAAIRPVVAREIRELEQRMKDASRWIAPLHQEIGRVIVGQRALVDRLLLGLLTNGHILLEGVPGLAKTLALKTLAGCIDGARFGRIAVHARHASVGHHRDHDLHPRDGDVQIKHGPIFANLVLADEINRAPAKVQSALLEAMQERQVTLGDATFPLPDPFLVLATQNPLEQEGTYPLPEAQLDRFMMKVLVQYPDAPRSGRSSTRWPSRSVLDVLRRHADAIVDARRVVDECTSTTRSATTSSASCPPRGSQVGTTLRSRASCAPAPRRAARSR